MAYDCGCTNTGVDCTCPEPSGIQGSTLEAIFTADIVSSESIAGAGYTATLYTNTSSNNQSVIIESNMYISTSTAPPTAAPHTITTIYKNDGVTVTGAGTLVHYAPYKSDHTHFLPTTTLAPGKSITLVITSDDADGVLNWLTSVIYKYDL